MTRTIRQKTRAFNESRLRGAKEIRTTGVKVTRRFGKSSFLIFLQSTKVRDILNTKKCFQVGAEQAGRFSHRLLLTLANKDDR